MKPQLRDRYLLSHGTQFAVRALPRKTEIITGTRKEVGETPTTSRIRGRSESYTQLVTGVTGKGFGETGLFWIYRERHEDDFSTRFAVRAEVGPMRDDAMNREAFVQELRLRGLIR